MSSLEISRVTPERIKVLALLFFITFTISLHAQQGEQRRVQAYKMDAMTTITIDGVLDELVWDRAEIATRFTVYDPDFGRVPRQQTNVRFLYSGFGLYIGMQMQDSSPDSIFTDLSVRDDMGNADWAGVVLSPSRDGQNGFRFQISAAGVQYDAKVMMDNNDVVWDAVWQSAVAISEAGWTAELLIPWSAIRFSNAEVQEWDMNIIREVRRYREQSTWQPVDKKRHGFLTQSGSLTHLINLETPVRLALLPYTSGYMQIVSGQSNPAYSFNAGMDVKYGILNNYTLDLTLIPDFGQIRSDDEIYNFSPYEVRYQENRPFFTEGTELFDKSGIFYTRRIGQMPVHYDRVQGWLNEHEIIASNPIQTQLINATKFSGRNSKGFAIGIFNAMTGMMYATLSDTLSGAERGVTTQPFTNYNLVVLDQTLPHNSHIHFANTNLMRSGYLANVTATTFQLKDARQRLAFSGSAMASQRHSEGAEMPDGFRYSASLARISGNLRWRVSHSATSKHYNPNDMGYLARNNEANVFGEVSYNRFTPVRNMLNYFLAISASHNMLQEGFQFAYTQMNFRASTTYLNRLSVGSSMEIVPGMHHDYYEARSPGRVFVKPGFVFARMWLSPDYRKRFLTDINVSGWKSNDTIQSGYSLSVSPRLRLTTRSLVILQFYHDREAPSIGYIAKEVQDDSLVVLFGEREINNLTLSMTGNYIINPVSSFSLRLRHYWVTTRHSRFFLLSETGTLEDLDYSVNRDFAVNFFTVDFTYSWNFAPGSFLHLVYKNALNNRIDLVSRNYIRNWEQLLDFPALNSFSLKMSYYIDYETTRRRIKSEKR